VSDAGCDLSEFSLLESLAADSPSRYDLSNGYAKECAAEMYGIGSVLP
jgi:hypothetical protein